MNNKKNLKREKKIIKYSAFSLMEMIVVLVIMGVIVSTMLPLFDGKAAKNKAAERFAEEINNLIAAEQNYYMKNKNSEGVHIYSNSLDELVQKHYIYRKPNNPFYNEEIQYNKYNINGVKVFSLKFHVPKDTVGKFFNTIPNLKKIGQSGNKITLQTKINIPSLEAGLSNLMHRDSGVNQELRTSHGPIQITDNVKPYNSYLLITNDNTQDPETIKNKITYGSNNIINSNKGAIRIGYIDNSDKVGIYGANKNGELFINANLNNHPSSLIIGADKEANKGSGQVIIGLKGNVIEKLYKFNKNGKQYEGTAFFHDTRLNSNSQKLIGYIGHTVNNNEGKTSNYMVVTDNTINNYVSVDISRRNNKLNERIIFMRNDNNSKKSEVIEYKTQEMPLSFIGSIGGIYKVCNRETSHNPNKLSSKYYGKSCAGGNGIWKYVILGLNAWAIGNTGRLIDSNKPLYYDIKTDFKYQAKLYKVRETAQGSSHGMDPIHFLYDVDLYTKADAKSYVNSAPAIPIAVAPYLVKNGNTFYAKCVFGYNYVKDGTEYIMYTNNDNICCFKVALMCVPTDSNNPNYNPHE